MRSTPSILAAFVSLFAGSPAAPAGPLVVDVWPGKVPDETGTIGAERALMSPKLDRTQVEVTEPTRMITDVTKPTLTIYKPPKEKDSGTAMVICPGGGYWNLYWQLEGEEAAAWLNSIGVTGIILKYRVPRRPDEPRGEPARRPLQDAQRAVSLVRSRAAEWDIDPGRIGIGGFSAGGHLAIATATSFDRRTYESIDDVDKTSCRPDFAVLVYPGYLKAKDADELAPGLRVPSGTPPVYLAHGGDDIISPPQHSVVMYLALKRAGIPAELHIYATAAHDFGVRASDHPCSTWTESCANWLRDQGFLRPGAVPLRTPLRASKNPHYFADGSGAPLILCGSHTWNSLQDWGTAGSPRAFDFDAFVSFLEAHRHNCTLLWCTELPTFRGLPTTETDPPDFTVGPFPWQSTGPGLATEGASPRSPSGSLSPRPPSSMSWRGQTVQESASAYEHPPAAEGRGRSGTARERA